MTKTKAKSNMQRFAEYYAHKKMERAKELLSGMTPQQLEYLIQINDITYVITYTTAPELDWYDAFRTSIDSVQIVYE